MEILKQWITEFVYSLKCNLGIIFRIFSVINIYFGIYLAIRAYQFRGSFQLGFELLIPMLVYILIAFYKKKLRQYNFGVEIPIPRKRYTTKTDTLIQINEEDLKEIILYLANVEDYLRDNGKL
ncbi:hypothetical protein [Clostridium sp.]|uniref:hypothetical protein n=1 Tax=Clostridium sp. TaxID=1506 RepID=UPI001A39FF05|nr:hypothetical protein [Clostridium sp.]MBK5234095.1 hypothetical protein [Clostridium sp.]